MEDPLDTPDALPKVGSLQPTWSKSRHGGGDAAVLDWLQTVRSAAESAGLQSSLPSTHEDAAAVQRSLWGRATAAAKRHVKDDPFEGQEFGAVQTPPNQSQSIPINPNQSQSIPINLN
eukprot:SAG31_NODE_2198_length_6212_cov_3.843096_9_plen_118_part_00